MAAIGDVNDEERRAKEGKEKKEKRQNNNNTIFRIRMWSPTSINRSLY